MLHDFLEQPINTSQSRFGSVRKYYIECLQDKAFTGIGRAQLHRSLSRHRFGPNQRPPILRTGSLEAIGNLRSSVETLAPPKVRSQSAWDSQQATEEVVLASARSRIVEEAEQLVES